MFSVGLDGGLCPTSTYTDVREDIMILAVGYGGGMRHQAQNETEAYTGLKGEVSSP